MKTKTSEISISATQKDQILENWKSQAGTTFDPELLDDDFKAETDELKLTLRVPY